jgi:tetratricopeptide (TPR) repeat protein
MTDAGDNQVELSPDAARRRVDRAMAMLVQGNLDAALGDFVEVEASLRYTPDPAARIEWARCLNGLGFIDLMDAKEARAAIANVDDAAEAAFRWGLKQALARFEQALAVQTDARLRAYAAGNRAYALALLGHTNDAREAFRRLFADGGQEAFDGQVRDTEWYPIPEDRAVRRLLDEAWEDAAP